MVASARLISPTHPSLHFAHPTLESFIWNILIRGNAQATVRSAFPPVSIYFRMRFHGVSPDFHTFPFLLQSFNSPFQSFNSPFHLLSGKQIHAQAVLFGLFQDPFVQPSLITMYSSCGDLIGSRQVFDEISQPAVASWNSIIHAYVKVGSIDFAQILFDKMPEKDVRSWSSMINGQVRCGKYKEALALFRQMQMTAGSDVRPNEYTISSVLSACGRLGALEHGKWAHAYIDRCGININVILGTCLIDMYAKCGSIEKARDVFTNLGPHKDVMAWSAMISGLAMHGHCEQCLQLFSEMIKRQVRPNEVTFLGVLCACVHGGLVNDAKNYFWRMSKEFGISPSIQHYGAMVDLYGRAGLVDEAWNVIKSMPMEPDVLVWGSLLSGSRMHGNIETCEVALSKLIELDPTNSGAYVLLSNVYAKTGRWMGVRRVRDLMETRGIKKLPGCSSVEMGGVLHEFFVGDDSHPERREIYMMLDEIMKRLKVEGYVGSTTEILLDLDEEGKEVALFFHSEKIATAFCFLKTSPGTPIRIMKNLRICVDCHVAMKMISKVFAREIVIRDCNRFHHFKEGNCSCKDYW